MSESDQTGYGDSPDTIHNGPDDAAGEQDTTLTTDDDAQRDDSVERPGNEPD